MATIREQLAAMRAAPSASIREQLTALRTRSGATGSWEEPAVTGDPRARIGEAIWRGVKGAASQLDPSGIVEMVKHPIDTMRGLVDTRPQAMEAMNAAAMAIPGGNIEPSVMDSNSRFDYATKAAKKAISAIPVVGPIAEGITDSITGSLAEGDVAGAVGKGAMNLALARSPKVARAAGEGVSAAGGRMAARQVGKCAEAMSTDAPLSESLATKMMERGITGSDPARAAALATEREAAALASRDALPKPKATLTAKGAQLDEFQRPLMEQRGALADEAKFQANVRTIMEALPESKSVRNVLIDGIAKRGGKYGAYGAAASIMSDAVSGGAATAVAGGVTAFQTLREITKTAAFKTASPIYKRRFAEALRTKDLGTAAEVGAGILSGALIADDFGHAQAIQNLSSETEQLGSPDLRRQRVTSLKAFYEQPDGSRIEIPRNVMTAMAGSPRADATASPLLSYLSAMESRGSLKKGGRVIFE